MTTVKHILDQKGHDVHCIHPDASVFDALKMMAENNIGSLVVLEDDKLVGLLSTSLDPGMLAGLEALEFLCIDDLDAVCGDAAWEEALFHLFNRVAAAGGAWVAAADRSPGTLPVRLADLGSRLAWGTSYRLKPLDDEARAQLLVERAARRGLRINRETADYLIRRSPRETGETLALLDRLDRASLAAKRRITIPFAREVLGWD